MNDPRLALLLHHLELAYHQRSWHGPNLRGSLRGISLDEASYRPQRSRHNVWELMVHCAYWKYRVCRLVSTETPRAFSIRGSDWFERPLHQDRASWEQDLRLLDDWHQKLLETVAELDPDDLERRARSSAFTILELVSGAAAHDLYHAGQIRLLRRMYADRPDP